ncbi:ribbon-helix-helix domain-containing protein [Radicibacter daui]|uniref:ribbon-helix-helix domain-containing protein n=1 Tax=Radicibacter daui TaxID=3064829 RepID=UPI004046F505
MNTLANSDLPRRRGRSRRPLQINQAAPSTLISRNIHVGRRRTSMRLEATMWDAFYEISEREGMSVDQLCTLIDRRRSESSLTAAVRVFVMSYFRNASRHQHGSATSASELVEQLMTA